MDIFEKLKEIVVANLKIDPERITMESHFKQDFKVDSIDLFELIMTMEDTFGVELDDESVAEIDTVADLVRFIKNNM